MKLSSIITLDTLDGATKLRGHISQELKEGGEDSMAERSTNLVSPIN
jgi:hypothetical protein